MDIGNSWVHRNRGRATASRIPLQQNSPLVRLETPALAVTLTVPQLKYLFPDHLFELLLPTVCNHLAKRPVPPRQPSRSPPYKPGNIFFQAPERLPVPAAGAGASASIACSVFSASQACMGDMRLRSSAPK